MCFISNISEVLYFITKNYFILLFLCYIIIYSLYPNIAMFRHSLSFSKIFIIVKTINCLLALKSALFSEGIVFVVVVCFGLVWFVVFL